jgi:hypothetical protein
VLYAVCSPMLTFSIDLSPKRIRDMDDDFGDLVFNSGSMSHGCIDAGGILISALPGRIGNCLFSCSIADFLQYCSKHGYTS